MFNSLRHFIKNITFNSKLNREKFINNKKIVNKIINKNKNKNNNMIIVRKMSTYTHPSWNDADKIFYMFIMASVAYIQKKYNKRR
jgi:hypothetical protein